MNEAPNDEAKARQARHQAHHNMLREHVTRKQWRQDDLRKARIQKPRKGCLTALVH